MNPEHSASEGLTFDGAPFSSRARRLRLWGSVFLCVAIVLVVFWTYLNIERELRTTLQQKLNAVLLSNVHSTEKWLREQQLLVERVARNTRLGEAMAIDAQGPRRAAVDDALSALIHAGLIEHFAVFGPSFEPLGAGLEGDSAALDETSRTRARLLGSSVRLAPPGAAPGWANHVIAIARVGSADAPRGYVAVCVDPSDEAAGLATSTWGQSGSTFVFQRSGQVLARSAGAWVAPGRAMKLADHARLQPGTFFLDLNGDFLDPRKVGAFVWLPIADVGIAAQVERNEAYESVGVLRRSFIVLLVLIGVVLLGFLALGRWSLRVRDESVLVSQRLGRLARTIQPLSAALEHDPGAVVLVDEAGSVIYANAAARSILDVDEPLIGKSAHTVFEHLHSELREAVVSGVEAIVAQKPGKDEETLLVTSRPLRIEGKPHVMYTLRPVTREVRRQEVEHWKKLIRVLSHELNNTLAPITSLVSSARTLNELHFHDEKLGKILDAIAERTTHLVSFLESYRSLARLPRPSPRPVEWESFLEGVRLQRPFAILGPMPSEPGYFDPIQLERVLINALDNAVEAGSPVGEVEIAVSNSDDGALLEILDRGSGMTEPVLRQAMLPFFSTKASGTGVGLALSREIVEAHGGQMTLANREGGGLAVSILLPPPRPPALSERSFPSLPEVRLSEHRLEGRGSEGRFAESRPPESHSSESRPSENRPSESRRGESAPGGSTGDG